MVETKTLMILGALAVAAIGVGVYASSQASPKLITESGEKKDTKKRKRPARKAQTAPAGTTAPSIVEVASPQANFRTWEFPPLGITLSIPDTWNAEEASEASTFITKFSGLAGGEKSQALIVVESHQERLSPEEFLQKFKEVASSMMPVSFADEKKVSFAGREGYEAVYTQNLAMFGQPGEIKNYVCLTTVENLGLCFQFTASSTDYSYDIETIKQVSKTLTMTPPPSTSITRFCSELGFSFQFPISFNLNNACPIPESGEYTVQTFLKDADSNSGFASVKFETKKESLDEILDAMIGVLQGPTDAAKSSLTVVDHDAKSVTFTKGPVSYTVIAINGESSFAFIIGAPEASFAEGILASAAAKDVAETQMNFENAELGFGFMYPTSMTVSEGLGQVIVSADKEGPLGMMARTSVERLDSQVTLPLLAQAIESEVSSMQQQGIPMKIDKQQSIEVNGMEALRIIMTQTNPMIGIVIKEVKTFIDVNNTIFTVSSSTTESSFTPKIQEIFESIAASFYTC